MFDLARTAQARSFVKWFACALLLLAPGSFIVLPLLWLARHWPTRVGVLAKMRQRAASRIHTAHSPKIA